MSAAAAAEAFGSEVQRRRQGMRMSRTELARRTGLSKSGITNIEIGVGGPGGRRWSEPKRESVIDIAVALGWDPDAALATAGRDSLQPVEQEHLTATLRAGDPRDELEKLWPALTGPQRQAIVRVAATMIDPQSRHEDQADVVLYRFEATDDHETGPTGR